MPGPNFANLMNRPAGQAKPPTALPEGVYSGIIKSWANDETKNKTPLVRFVVTPTAWPDEIDDDARQGIDLSTRQLRRDFFMSEDAMHRLDTFIRSCGIDPTDQTYAEVMPQLIGMDVLATVKHRIVQRPGEDDQIIADVSSLVGLAA
jgi:hypothetical protein